jgi:hypothetical protein
MKPTDTYFRNKKREYLKDKINELATNKSPGSDQSRR